MAIIGHWKNLDEVAKLTQSTLLAGIVQELWYDGQLMRMMPVTRITGTSLKWNREKSLPTADFVGIGEQIAWKSDVDYDSTEFSLKQIIRQDPLDKFVAQNYRTINDYRAVMLQSLTKGVQITMEDHLLYGDEISNAKAFNGLHNLVSATKTDMAGVTKLAYDAGEAALSISKLRRWIDAMSPPPTFLVMSKTIAQRLDDALTFGISTGSTNIVVGGLAMSTLNGDWGSARFMTFDGIPVIRSDFMVAEQANTGPGSTGANARAKYTSGTKQYSIIAVRTGQLEMGGVSLLVGDATAGPDFIFPEFFDKLESYNAEGIRLISYMGLANGATGSVGVMFDITDAAVTT